MDDSEGQSDFCFWSLSEADVLLTLGSSPAGLTTIDVRERAKRYGSNEVMGERRLSRLRILWRQLKSHLLIILFIAAIISIFSGEWIDSSIIIIILMGSVGLGYLRNYQAEVAISDLKTKISTKIKVLRDGQELLLDVKELVPGDIFILAAGNLVPADARILSSKDLFVNEAVLTGETFPVEKQAGMIGKAAELSKRTNCVFHGTNVRAGIARCVVVKTGSKTQFGAIAGRLSLKPPETQFDRGLRKFGDFLTISMFVMTLIVFAANILLERPVMESLLFSVALAVGLSPELLPAILNVNLAHGAKIMAKQGVIVRNLNAIENLGSMTVLCSDKTGTLTEGVVQLEGSYNWQGIKSKEILELASINAALQTGLSNPLDKSILQSILQLPHAIKISEIPYDFVRKRMSVVIDLGEGRSMLITKGACSTVLAASNRVDCEQLLSDDLRERIQKNYEIWSAKGIRVLAVATKVFKNKEQFTRDDEVGLDFRGFVTFMDRPKEGVRDAISSLRSLGVDIKIITGDAKPVAQYVTQLVGLDPSKILTGKDLDELHEEALWNIAIDTAVFAEVDPNQKERIILSLKKMGAVVGFLGDGINDAPAMHAADTSLSVEGAVDVARDVADFVLLDRNLHIIRLGIEQGRRTFANTLKYVFTTMSANLGNMISMAIASIVLPYLPLLAGQVLLNNFLSDIPAIGLATDYVDSDMVAKPERWDMRLIQRFMIEFGLVSSIFDFVTFGVLLYVYHAGAQMFRTTWFVESLLTELGVALILRTRGPSYRSEPGKLLFWLTFMVAVIALAIPYLPFSQVLGFVPLPPNQIFVLISTVICYLLATEWLKIIRGSKESLP